MCIRFPSVVFVSARYNQSGYLAFRMARVKDTKLTPAAIPFYVGLNNFLFFLVLQTYKKQFAEFIIL